MTKTAAKRPHYSFGMSWANPYLGSKFTEVLTMDKKRIGFIWTHTDGRVVVMPTIGFHVWFNEDGDEWTLEEGALWLVKIQVSQECYR